MFSACACLAFLQEAAPSKEGTQPNNFCMPIRPSSAICFSGHKLQQYRFSKCKRTIIIILKNTRCGLNIRTLSRMHNLFFVLLPGGFQSQGFHSLQAVRLCWTRNRQRQCSHPESSATVFVLNSASTMRELGR